MALPKIITRLWAIQNEVDEKCRKHIVIIINHLFKGSKWALQMFDSITKLPAGLLDGNGIDLGNFDECIEINVKEDVDSFRGQHCLAKANFNMMEKEKELLTWSMCTPSSCTAYDLSNLMSILLNHTIQVTPETCHIKETRSFTSEDFLAILILSVFGTLCMLSTAYDITVTNQGKKKDILRAFSWYTNGKQLLKIGSGSRETIKCLHGLRFLSIILIITGHNYFMQGAIPTMNMNTYRKALAEWAHVPIGLFIFSVESFFLMSGLLMGITFFKTMEKDKKFSIPFFYIRRYLRLTPILALTILIHSGLIIHMSYGPIWDTEMEHYPRVCKKNWWATLLYVQNYMHEHEMCITEAWYLAVDMQLCILSPLLLFPLFKRSKFGPKLLRMATVSSITNAFIALYLNDVRFGFQVEARHMFAQYFYTHTRATSWIIGLYLSYILHKNIISKHNANQWNVKAFSEKSVLIGWLLAFMCLFLPLAWGHRFSQTDFLPSSLEFSLYFSLAKSLWCLGLSWVIFACVSGYGGPVNSILSLGILQPLSRLTYSIYLIYFPFMLVKNYSTKYAIFFTNYNQIHSTFGILACVVLLAIPVHLTFEAPVTTLMKTKSDDLYEKIPNNKPCKA